MTNVCHTGVECGLSRLDRGEYLLVGNCIGGHRVERLLGAGDQCCQTYKRNVYYLFHKAVDLESDVHTHRIGLADRDVVRISVVSADTEDVDVVITLVTLVLEHGEEVVGIDVHAETVDDSQLAGHTLGQGVGEAHILELEVRGIIKEAGRRGVGLVVVRIGVLRYVGVGIRRSPGVQRILVEILSGIVALVHHTCIDGVIELAAEVVVEHEGEVQTLPVEVVGEGTETPWSGTALHVVVGIGVDTRRAVALLPQGIAVGGIHARPGRQVELILAVADLPYLLCVGHGDVVIARKVEYLICVVRVVETDVPAEVIVLYGGAVQDELKAPVAYLGKVHHHRTDLVVIVAYTVRSGKGILVEKSWKGLFGSVCCVLKMGAMLLLRHPAVQVDDA